MEKTITVNVNEAVSVAPGGNIKAMIVEGYLVIIVDPSVELGLSSTGKTMAVGSTSGFKLLPGDLMGNVYIGKKPE